MSALSSDDFDFDDAGLDELNQLENAYVNKTNASPAQSRDVAPNMTQRNLFGEAVVTAASTKRSTTTAKGKNTLTEPKVKPVKVWDRESFAKHGWSKRNAEAARQAAGHKGKKKKSKGVSEWNDYEEDEEVIDDDDDDQDADPDGATFFVDTTYDPRAPILPMKCEADAEAIKTWVYPVQADKPLRTYQYDIVHHALFDNTLVSLPTGLGKTFIAACVMLNFYRWFPKGKILFLAPSRPLVRQQIIACHYATGIPQEHCVELTGTTAPKLRAIGWATKRVIYSTPQTVENDLRKGRVDPRDITCLVVDEAHRATGDYAYCGVVRYLMSRNPHFRILALTATPGSKGEGVQEVIDNLHIGKIQVRTDASWDIKEYIHHKSFDLTVMPLGPDLSSIRDRWGALMQTYIGPLVNARLINAAKPDMLSPYACNMAYQKMAALPGGMKANGRFSGLVAPLSAMCFAMEYLIVESVTVFDSKVQDIGFKYKALAAKPEFKKIFADLKTLLARSGYVGHPKMERLRTMCWDHFKANEAELDPISGEPRQTRVMVFCNYRAVVEEIVACLNRHHPVIRATRFVGQSTAKGEKGMTQKEQNTAISKFKAGTFNVLVASSIGEEGLDIGEIDLIVCYEANKSPIRMLQRVGRTGRARDGHIIVLMTEGREEKYWDKAKDQYNEVQNALMSRTVFEVYADGKRLIPDKIKPINSKISIEASKLNEEKMVMTTTDLRVPGRGAKTLPVKKTQRSLPKNAFAGFRTASELKQSRTIQVSSSQALRERKQAALLSEVEEVRMNIRWYSHRQGSSTRHRVDASRIPLERDQLGSTFVFLRHGALYEATISALRMSAALDDSKPDALDKWHAQMSGAYDPARVETWDPPVRDPDLQFRQPPRLRPIPPDPQSDSALDEHPMLSQTPKSTSSPMITPEGPPSHSPDQKGIASLEFDDILDEDLAMLGSKYDTELILPSLPPTSKPELIAHAQEGHASLDLFGVLSSDEDGEQENGRDGSAHDSVRLPAITSRQCTQSMPPQTLQHPLLPRSSAPILRPSPQVPCHLSSVEPPFEPPFEPPIEPPIERPIEPPSGSSHLYSDFYEDEDFEIVCEADLLQGAVVRKFGMLPPAAAVSSDSSSPVRKHGRAAERVSDSGQAHLPSLSDIQSTISSPILLKRLRRGPMRAISENEQAADGDQPLVKAPRRKKMKLNAKTAARTKLFDVEAVNSSASGTEASSEDYDSENSEDARFVASEDEHNAQDSSSQARFYRESLMTQPPDGFAQPAFLRRTTNLVPFTPATPRSQPDEWSYDSFCARDDEEIEMDSSSMV